MPIFKQAYVSGDLGAAVASGPDGVWMIDSFGHHEATAGEVEGFFAHAVDVGVHYASDKIDLSLGDVSEAVILAGERFEHLHRLLMGMDGRLTEDLRRRAIHDAAGKLDVLDGGWERVQRRLLRAPRGNDWKPRDAAAMARDEGFDTLAELYEVLGGGILESLERHVLRHVGENGLSAVRQNGAVAAAALALHRQDIRTLEQTLDQSHKDLDDGTRLVTDFALRQLKDGKSAHLSRLGQWREISRGDVPSLEALFHDPIVDVDMGRNSEFYDGWARDHATRRRFYFTGIRELMFDFEMTTRDYEAIAHLGPEFVAAKTNWSKLPGDWKTPPSVTQFRRLFDTNSASLARGALVLAAVAAAAIDRGAEAKIVFRSLGVIPACYRISHLGDENLHLRMKIDRPFAQRLDSRTEQPLELLRDMEAGHTVTRATANIVHQMLLDSDDPAAVGEVLGRAARNGRAASDFERFQFEAPLESRLD